MTVKAALAAAYTVLSIAVAALLVVAAGFTLAGTVIDLIEGADSRAITDAGVFALERVLLLFIIAEMLYTLLLIDGDGRILVEPFLFIGLIAVVRRVLVVTAESEVDDDRSVVELAIELGGLATLVLVLAVAIHLLRRSAASQP